MTKRSDIRLFAAVLILLVALSACSSDLTTVAKALDDTSKAIGIFQTTIIQANTDKLLSDAETAKLMSVSVRVSMAGLQAVAITKQLSTLAPTDRANLLAILTPIIDALSDAQTLDVAGIANPATRQKVQAALLLIQTSLNTAQIVLAAKGQ